MLSQVPPLRCRASPSCRFSCSSSPELSAHLRARHSDAPFAVHAEIVCWHCGSAFERVPLLVLHSLLMHAGDQIVCGVRHLDLKQVKRLYFFLICLNFHLLIICTNK